MNGNLKSILMLNFMSNALFNVHLSEALISKGVLSKEAAASVMAETADSIRKASDAHEDKSFGSHLANQYESFAARLLGLKPRL
jgi:hypothetical protein